MKLTRSRNGMIGGVASGIARAINIDVTLVRLAFVLVSIFGGSGILVYLVLWAVIPREDDGGTLAEEGFKKARTWYDSRKDEGPRPPQDYNL